MEHYNTPLQKDSSSENLTNEDIKKIVLQYLRFWPLFVIFIGISVSLAFVYLRYTPNIYETGAKIKILKDTGGLDLSSLQGGSPLIDLSRVNLENEKEILTSRRISEKVVDSLELESSYYKQGNFKSSEIWDNQRPFKVTFIENDTLEKQFTPEYNIEFTALDSFKISHPEIELSKVLKIGEAFSFEGYLFQVDLNPNYEGDYTQIIGETYSFRFISTNQAISSLTGQVSAEPLGESSEILDIKMNGQNRSKNEDIINTLINQFNNDGIEDNRLLAKRTEEFVIERLGFLEEELDTVESGLVSFKSKNELVEVGENASSLLSKSSQAENRIFDISNQIALTKGFKEEILNGDEYDLLPARIGITNDNINTFTDTYNDKILERERLLVSSTLENPQVKQINKIISQLRNNILNTINSYLKSLEISLSELKRREREFDRNIGQLPGQQKKIRGIERQQAIKERLYLFLLQKREEAALSYAITAPTIKVVDYAYSKPYPIGPNSRNIFLFSIAAGFGIPFIFLYIFFLFDTKIKSKEQIKSALSNIPVIGEVPLSKDKKESIILPTDRSSLAESFRIIRTNLNYMSVKTKKSSKSKSEVVFVTSTTKAEGKTFVATNLASSLVAAKKKVLLIGSDLRNPQIHRYFGVKKEHIGVSNFLYDDSLSFDDLIIDNTIDGLDVILSGDVPPNPSEMLMGIRFEELIKQARERYDYVIVDTAPTVLVTDTILISGFADITLYITRAGFTDTRLLPHIKELQEQKRLNNMCIVINGLDHKGINAYNYGYGYGYGKNQTKKPFWNFW